VFGRIHKGKDSAVRFKGVDDTRNPKDKSMIHVVTASDGTGIDFIMFIITRSIPNRLSSQIQFIATVKEIRELLYRLVPSPVANSQWSAVYEEGYYLEVLIAETGDTLVSIGADYTGVDYDPAKTSTCIKLDPDTSKQFIALLRDYAP
jgi:hypothetical protein